MRGVRGVVGRSGQADGGLDIESLAPVDGLGAACSNPLLAVRPGGLLRKFRRDQGQWGADEKIRFGAAKKPASSGIPLIENARSRGVMPLDLHRDLHRRRLGSTI